MLKIAVAIQKGGSGKTTTTINLAAALQILGKKVLLVDLDPQANLTHALGYEDIDQSIYDLFKDEMDGEESNAEAVLQQSNGLSFIPGSLELASTELELVSAYAREKLLSLILEPLKDKFDYAIIDCPPAIGMLTVNALTASKFVLMPMRAEFLPYKGLLSFMRSIKRIKRQLNPDLEMLGLLLTQFDQRKGVNKQVKERIKMDFGHLLFQSEIRNNIALAKAQQYGVDIFHYDKSANGAQDYMQLAQEFLERISKY